MSVKLICSFSFSVWAAAGRANLDFPSAAYCTAEKGGGRKSSWFVKTTFHTQSSCSLIHVGEQTDWMTNDV